MKQSAAEILAAKHDVGNGVRKPVARTRPKTSQKLSGTGEGAFTVANRVPTRDVLDRLGISYGEKFAVCPGCGEDGALLCAEGGIKCLHQRCAHVGPTAHPGFRTNVDLVAQIEQLLPAEAAARVCEWFGLQFAKKSAPADDYEHSDADDPQGAPASEPRPAEKPQTGKKPISVNDVLGEWSQQGPLVHEPTGITQLDDLTGGGPVYGTRWYLAGAPDAGKTALLVQLAHVYLLRGVTVGLLAVDEEAGDIVTRFAQRIGYSRTHCEVRDPGVLQTIGHALGRLPLRLYDGTWTIEDAATDLAGFAKQRAEQDPANHPHGPRAMLGIDSVQTVRCAADTAAQAAGREQSEVSAVTSRVTAIRAMASKHRLIALATSELGRGAYRSSDPSQQTATLAAGKWSGAIEYSARVLLGLRSVANEPELVELELAKNKHGPRDEKVYLRIDRRSQMLSAVAYDAPPTPSSADRDGAARDRVALDAVVVARVLWAQPGLGVRELRAAVRAASGLGVERVNAAVAYLGDAVIRGEGLRGATPMSLDLSSLPENIQKALEESK